ncbi:hypothetical protein K443DRAFT_4151 [Laccaria amethystina LaAM-08-1]|uniref:Uncharacterized protein n=1 Tax=Laccaria amethystina LaAM-08-1 TaxID=1095629 RepID=A0A0C9YAC9_9AGAR|nr:hypothetical protein K443DRAFT_4151 [Laccaria amethystina LaAM-08-1]
MLVLHGTHAAHAERMKSTVSAERLKSWQIWLRGAGSSSSSPYSEHPFSQLQTLFFSKMELLRGGLAGRFECQCILFVESSQLALAPLKSQRILLHTHIRPLLLLNETNGQRHFAVPLNAYSTAPPPPNIFLALFTVLLTNGGHWKGPSDDRNAQLLRFDVW